MTLFLEPFAPFELLRHMAGDGTRSFIPAADVVGAAAERRPAADHPRAAERGCIEQRGERRAARWR